MANNKKPTTKKQAKKQIRATGKKPVVISKRTIKKFGAQITENKVAFGKKTTPTRKGKVIGKIKYVGSREKRKVDRRKKQRDRGGAPMF